jgi:transglutaminase-like putative cysteine protease
MRLAIDHRTHYRFSEPQARLIELLRLTPADTQDQTVVAWRIDVDCDARLRGARDGFGNLTNMLYADGPIEDIEIVVTGEVLTSDSGGLVRGTTEPFPPSLFLRGTERTSAGGSLAAFAASMTGGDTLARIEALNAALHARFGTVQSSTDAGLSADEAFTATTAAPRDLAQMFVAAARSLQVPARYVSGYSTTGTEDGAQAAAHAWGEVCVGDGWMAFDPSHGCRIDENYVRVAVALDATGAAPIVGARIGAGDEALDVDLHVDRLGGEE